MEATKFKRVFPKPSKWFRVVLLLGLILIVLYLFRIPLLKGMSSFLNNADSVQQVDVLVVLGGSPVDRGYRGAELFHQGLVAGDVYCTGGYTVPALEAFKIDVTESGLTRNVMIDHKVPESRIIELQQSTSTWEEAQEVKELLKNKNWKKVGVVSSEYHIRRVKWTFDKVFTTKDDVEILFFASDSDHYNAEEWWKDEESFLITYGEFTKLLFYLLKY